MLSMPFFVTAFLALGDFNVIVVVWEELANSNYVTASAGVPNVGIHIGNFLLWLLSTAGGNWNNIHLVGFSLGAHVIGNTGRHVFGQISRLTGTYNKTNKRNRSTKLLHKLLFYLQV